MLIYIEKLEVVIINDKTEVSPRMKSPTPPPTQKSLKLVDFPEAMRAVILEKKVTKQEWANTEMYCALRSGNLKIRTECTKPDSNTKEYEWVDWIVGDGDMLGEDWIILN